MNPDFVDVDPYYMPALSPTFAIPPKDSSFWKPIKIFVAGAEGLSGFESEQVSLVIPAFAPLKNVKASWTISADKDRDSSDLFNVKSRIVLHGEFFYSRNSWCSSRTDSDWDATYSDITDVAREAYSEFYDGILGLHKDLLILFADKQFAVEQGKDIETLES